MVIRLHTLIAQINPNMQVAKPIHLWWKLLFQHLVIMIMATKGPTEKNDELAWEGHHRILQRVLFFSRVAKLAGGSLLQALRYMMPDRGGSDDGACVADDGSQNAGVAPARSASGRVQAPPP